jgi:hypothetical protein
MYVGFREFQDFLPVTLVLFYDNFLKWCGILEIVTLNQLQLLHFFKNCMRNLITQHVPVTSTEKYPVLIHFFLYFEGEKREQNIKIGNQIQWGPWIWIRTPDPDPGGPKGPTKIENVNKFHFVRYWMFSFEC